MPGGDTLRRCTNTKEADDVIVIDVDSEHFDSVIIIDVPDPLSKKWLGYSVYGEKEKWPCKTVLCIDNDESSDDDDPGPGVNENVIPMSSSKGKNVCFGKASTNNRYGLSTDSESPLSDNEHPDCELMEDSSGELRQQWKEAFVKRTKDIHHGQSGAKDHNSASSVLNDDNPQNVRTECTNGQRKEPPFCSSTGKTNLGNEAQSQSDGHIRSPLKAKHPPSNDAEQKDGRHSELFSRSCQNKEAPKESFHGKPSLVEEEAPISKSKMSSEMDSENVRSSRTDKGKKLQDTSTSNIKEKEHLEPRAPFASSNVNNVFDSATKIGQDTSSVETGKIFVEPVSPSMHDGEDAQKHNQNGGTADRVDDCILNDREKLKETDEYKRALEAEWAARQQALKIQAAEAYNLRQLRKRKKAESTRTEDMEKRQKQRLEEIRETQKKDGENLNLKEAIRAEVRKKLQKLEKTCDSMASLLQSLGVQVGSGPRPSRNELQSAYKRALLLFHPDRASRSDIHQQVEAEEKFKLINRLKEKLCYVDSN